MQASPNTIQTQPNGVNLTLGQTARMLQVSVDTARRLFESGAFPNAFRVSTHRRVPQADVERFMATREHGKAIATGGAA